MFSEQPCQQICPTKQKWKLQKHTRFSKSGTNTKLVAEEAQLAANSKNSRLFYQIIKELYGLQQSIFAPLKSKDGATMRRPEDIKKRWC